MITVEEAQVIYKQGEAAVVNALTELSRRNEELRKQLEQVAAAQKTTHNRMCDECLKKQVKIDRLEERVLSLQSQARYHKRRMEEGYFGSGTPSSQVPTKPSSSEDNQKKKGGAVPGHEGHGRRSITEAEADKLISVSAPSQCPHCHETMQSRGVQERSVLDIEPIRYQKILYMLEQKSCPHCGYRVRAKTSGVLPHSLYGNQLLAESLVMHYVHGIPLGRIAALLHIDTHHLLYQFHHCATIFKPIREKLIEELRKSPVIHADETTWRTDGKSGYSWLFCTNHIHIFCVQRSRAASVVTEVLGDIPLSCILVTDRYPAYNCAPCLHQYCYAHLLRTLLDLLKNYTGEQEVNAFVQTCAPLLAQAMQLRSQPITDQQYYEKAEQLKKAIVTAMSRQAGHLAIIEYQNIFVTLHDSLYRWVENRDVPADNNLAERIFRLLVIARKVSFGSQSTQGAETREIHMSVLQTINACFDDVVAIVKDTLDHIVFHPSDDLFSFIFSKCPKFFPSLVTPSSPDSTVPLHQKEPLTPAEAPEMAETPPGHSPEHPHIPDCHITATHVNIPLDTEVSGGSILHPASLFQSPSCPSHTSTVITDSSLHDESTLSPSPSHASADHAIPFLNTQNGAFSFSSFERTTPKTSSVGNVIALDSTAFDPPLEMTPLPCSSPHHPTPASSHNPAIPQTITPASPFLIAFSRRILYTFVDLCLYGIKLFSSLM